MESQQAGSFKKRVWQVRGPSCRIQPLYSRLQAQLDRRVGLHVLHHRCEPMVAPNSLSNSWGLLLSRILTGWIGDREISNSPIGPNSPQNTPTTKGPNRPSSGLKGVRGLPNRGGPPTKRQMQLPIRKNPVALIVSKLLLCLGP